MARDTVHLRVRVEQRLLARLEKAREKGGRTLTGEIVHRLEESFRQADEVHNLAAEFKQGIAVLRDLVREQESAMGSPREAEKQVLRAVELTRREEEIRDRERIVLQLMQRLMDTIHHWRVDLTGVGEKPEPKDK
jgi:hypothetical protein